MSPLDDIASLPPRSKTAQATRIMCVMYGSISLPPSPPLQFSHMTSTEISMKSVANAAAQRLVKLALNGGSVDDISVIVNVYEW